MSYDTALASSTGVTLAKGKSGACLALLALASTGQGQEWGLPGPARPSSSTGVTLAKGKSGARLALLALASSTVSYSGQGQEWGLPGPARPSPRPCAEASFTQPGPDTGGEPPALLQPPSGHSTPRVLVFKVQGDSLRVVHE